MTNQPQPQPQLQSGLRRGKPFFGLVQTPAGENFTDMSGRIIAFEAADIPTYATNTARAIAAIRRKKMPGLPIDARQHDKGEAAGWIVGVRVGEVDGLAALEFTTDWTALGVELISQRVMTNFSPTVDVANKTVRGGSLTNWPATVDGSNNPIFPAIELSEVSMTKSVPDVGVAPPVEIGDVIDLAAVSEQTKTDLRDYAAKVLQAARTQALAEAKLAFADMQRQAELAEFCQMVTTGTPQNPRVLPVAVAELSQFARQLSPEQAATFKALIQKIWEAGTVSTATVGHGGQRAHKTELPAAIAESLKSGRLKVTDLSNPILNLGDLSVYDLTQYGGSQ